MEEQKNELQKLKESDADKAKALDKMQQEENLS